MLKDLCFGSIDVSWSAAEVVAAIWLPTIEGRLDSRIVQIRGRTLLSSLILDVRRRSTDCAHMEAVRGLIQQEIRAVGSVLDRLSLDPISAVRTIALSCRSARGCWFGDAVPYLALNVTEEKVTEVAKRWCARHSSAIA
jgi:hypothetical protein